MAFFKIFWIKQNIKSNEKALKFLLDKNDKQGLTNKEKVEANILSDLIKAQENKIEALKKASLN